jgi:tripartite-type tricarboxylate transporter receptor subunit TctC
MPGRGREMWMQRSLFVSFALGAALTVIGGASGQISSSRPIKIVVPFAAGGAVDALARFLSDEMGRSEGMTFVVEDRPGAGTVIGTEAVSHAQPDGHTLLMTANSFVINPHLKKLPYNALSSFEPLCLLARSPHVIVVSATSPYQSLGELLDAARAKPGELTMAANGPATAHHIAFEMLQQAANVKITFVPYPGPAPAATALLGGHVASANVDLAVVAEHLRAGKLRALAVLSRERIEGFSNVPTAIEAGLNDVEMEGTLGIVAPAGAPKEVISKLSAWLTAALRAPGMQAKLTSQGLDSVGMCGANFGAYLQKQYDEYGRIIRQANIHIN